MNLLPGCLRVTFFAFDIVILYIFSIFIRAMGGFIKIRGARENLDIPKNKLVVFTGVSGSGKSSLAFNTIYAEGQRRYVESLSAYARQFLDMQKKPDVDLIEGLSPAISIEQKTTSKNPRSTVGTVVVGAYWCAAFAGNWVAD